MRLSSTPVLALVAWLVACGNERTRDSRPAVATPPVDSPSAMTLPTGEGRLAVEGGSIWYKLSGTGAGTPVVLLHGGPGYSSFYLKPLEALGDDRPVVRYDQLGSGKSDKVTDTALFNIGHFVRELETLRVHLGYAKIHVLGHSWGTILAVEYYRAHPDRVVSLTLGSAALDIPTWERNALRLVKTLSDTAQKAIALHEKDHKFDAPDYQAANQEFFSRYVTRRPSQVDLDSTMRTMNEDLYVYMQGPSEFTVTGTLKEYNSTPFLKDITVPVLFTVGQFDEADPPTIKRQAQMIPGAKVAVIDSAAHITTWDNPTQTIAVVRDFLRSVDAGSAKR